MKENHDVISRETTISKILSQPPELHYPNWYATIVKEMPSASPVVKRETGEWIAEHHGGFSPGGNPLYRCSKCGWVYGTHSVFPTYRYCPECGRYNYSNVENESGRIESTTDPSEFYIFTFKHGQDYEGYYVKIYGSYESAGKKMIDLYGAEWDAQYSENDWKSYCKYHPEISDENLLEVIHGDY